MAIAGWGKGEGSLKEMGAWCSLVTLGCLSSKRRGVGCVHLNQGMEHSPGRDLSG